MNKHSNPIEFLIEFALSNGADRFVVNNAKDELGRLQKISKDMSLIFERPVAYGKINDRHDLYMISIMHNPYEDQDKVVPLYSNRKEFLSKDWKGYNDYAKFKK